MQFRIKDVAFEKNSFRADNKTMILDTPIKCNRATLRIEN